MIHIIHIIPSTINHPKICIFCKSPFFSFAFISFTVLAHQQYKTSLVAPITKDTTTSPHRVTLNCAEEYVIDLEASFLWWYCQFPRTPIPCSSRQCSLAKSYLSPFCPQSRFKKCFQKWQVQLFSHSHKPHFEVLSELCSSYLILFLTDSKNPTDTINSGEFPISCAPQTLLDSLPKDVVGVAGLSQAPLALPKKSSAFHNGLTRKFSLCLPNTEQTKGVIFFRDGPFYFLPPAKVDLMGSLSYTPLLKHSKSPEYYISLKGISINGKATHFRRNTFELDSLGNGGAKISTTVPDTVLRTDIYKTIFNDFSEAIKFLPRAMKTGPFELCVNARKIRLSVTPFPQIDLELGNGKNWTIYKPNSIIDMGNSVGCLAFVDGGLDAKQAVVIGSYQMENQFLLFDLDASRFAFRSSLSFYKTTCGGFNFTSAG